MNKITACAAAIAALIAAPAFAATVKKKTPPPPAPAPVYSWTGWYVGGNVGYSWGNARTDIAGTASRQTSEGISSGLPPVTLPFADSNTARLNGIIGGGQLGYNYQFGPQWVLGFEADIQGTGERGSNTFVDPLSGGPICRTFALGSGCIEFVPVSGAAKQKRGPAAAGP